MNFENQVTYWLESARHDLDTAEGLFSIAKYDWCLFIGHLVIEKALKALYVKNRKDVPPRTHNLMLLAENAGISLSDNQKIFLETANDFNIEARYPDQKLSFYKICTKDFTQENFKKIKDLYAWLTQKQK